MYRRNRIRSALQTSGPGVQRGMLEQEFCLQAPLKTGGSGCVAAGKVFASVVGFWPSSQKGRSSPPRRQHGKSVRGCRCLTGTRGRRGPRRPWFRPRGSPPHTLRCGGTCCWCLSGARTRNRRQCTYAKVIMSKGTRGERWKTVRHRGMQFDSETTADELEVRPSPEPQGEDGLHREQETPPTP